MYLFGTYYAFVLPFNYFYHHIWESQGDNEASGFESEMWVAVDTKGMNLQLVSLSAEDDFGLFIYLFLFVVNFVIHWNETAMGLHVFPIPIPPPTSLSTRSL